MGIDRSSLPSLSDKDIRQIEIEAKHERMLRDPDVKKIISHRLFDVTIGCHIKPNHLALDGGIAPADWPGWNRCAPPLGEKCNCALIGISEGSAIDMLTGGSSFGRGPFFDLTIKIPDGAGPDKGWNRPDGWWERGESPGPETWLIRKEVPAEVVYPWEDYALELFTEIKPTIEANAGIRQTALYKVLNSIPSHEISAALYFAAKRGLLLRKKKGNTYEIRVP